MIIIVETLVGSLLPKFGLFVIITLSFLDFMFDPEVFLGIINYIFIYVLLSTALFSNWYSISLSDKLLFLNKINTLKKKGEIYEVFKMFFLEFNMNISLLFYILNILKLLKKHFLLKYNNIINNVYKKLINNVQFFEIKIIKLILNSNYYNYIIYKKNKMFYSFLSPLWRRCGGELVKFLFLLKKMDSQSFYK